MATSVILRPVHWAEDETRLGAIDNSFRMNRMYGVDRDLLAFRLEIVSVDPPIQKSYGSILCDAERVRQMRHVVVADYKGELVGVVAADLSEWNRRVQIEHVYVSTDWRGQGIGRALIDSVVGFARDVGSWCVWAETQNTNYPAIQFYLRYGFRLCGLDERLYDPATQALEEVALYFAFDLV